MSDFNKLHSIDRIAGLRKRGGPSGAPAAPSAATDNRLILGIPLANLQAIISACPSQLQARGQHALDKALRADAEGDRRSLVDADQQLASVITEPIELSNNQQFAKLLKSSRRTLSRTEFAAWCTGSR